MIFGKTLLRYGLLGFAAFLITLQTLFAAGFMPGQTVDGKTALIVCSGSNAKTIYVDAGTVPDDSQPVKKTPCSFSMMSHTVHTAPQADITPHLSTYPVSSAMQVIAIIHKTNVVLWHSRGPPTNLS